MIFGRKRMDIGKLREQASAPVPYGFDPQMTPDYSGADKPVAQTKPSNGKRILGSLLDGLGVAVGLEPTYLQGVQAQRQSQLEAQNAERARQAGLEDYEKKQEIESKYRPPQVNDTERDYQLYVKLYGEDKAKELLARPQYVQQANGQYLQLGGFNPNEAAQPSPPATDPAEIERFVASFPREAQPAIRAKIAEGALGDVPGGSPVGQGPRSKRLANGTTAYFVNGAWYDNPEGR